MSIEVGVYGGTGYTGLELVRLLTAHPEVSIRFVTSESSAGTSLRLSQPQAPDIRLIKSADAADIPVDCVFLCLPHTESARMASAALARGAKVVDLSADLRIDDPKVYEKWYGVAHAAPELLPVPYGLPELGREKLVGAKVIANPGCYATSLILGIAPLVRAGLLIEGAPIIADSASGVTGAGRTPKLNMLFGEVQGNYSPYNIGRSHRHLAEVEQVLAAEGLEAGQIVFSPHLLPTDRGILSTIYAQVSDAHAARAAFESMYGGEPLVELLAGGELASLAHIVRTPKAALSLSVVSEHMLIVVSALDNLLKGAASQAVQNFNLMFNLPETAGLIAEGAQRVAL